MAGMSTSMTEAIKALVGLGYKKKDAERVVGLAATQLPEDATAEHIVQEVMLGRVEPNPVHYKPNRGPDNKPIETKATDANKVQPESVADAAASLAPPKPAPEAKPTIADFVKPDEPPEGHTRFWHGGSEYKGGPRFVSPDKSYAEGYTDGNGRNLHYVDIPNNSPHLQKAFDDSGTNMQAPYKSFEAPEEIAKNLKPYQLPAVAPEMPMPAERPRVADFANAPDVQANERPAGNQSSSLLDKLQMGLDAAGVVDPTPIADGANAILSVTRAFMDPKNAGSHLTNAGISAISMVPYVGDIAKLFKYGGKAAKAAEAGSTAASAAGHAAINGAGATRPRGGGIVSSLMSLFSGGSAAATGGGGGMAGAGSGGNGGGAVPPGGSPAPGGAGGNGPVGGSTPIPAITNLLAEIGLLIAPFGILAIAVKATGSAFKSLIDWFDKVGESSKKMIEENRNLSQWTGQLAASYARLDRERLQREIEAARDMSGPLSRLTTAQSGLEQAQEDYTRPYKQLSTDIQGIVTEIARYGLLVIDILDPINDVLKMWYDQEKSDKTSRTAAEAAAKLAEAREVIRKF